jgi:hypothetical protein
MSFNARLSALEAIVGRLVMTQEATSAASLMAIRDRVAELGASVQQSSVILRDLLPGFKQQDDRLRNDPST